MKKIGEAFVYSRHAKKKQGMGAIAPGSLEFKGKTFHKTLSALHQAPCPDNLILQKD